MSAVTAALDRPARERRAATGAGRLTRASGVGLGVAMLWFSLLVLPVLIFCARIVDVSLDTMRILYMNRGRKVIAPLLGFVQALIWILAVSQVMKNLANPICYLAYGAGFATGNYVGMRIEEKVATGLLTPDDDGFGSLRLTAASRAVLRGEQTVWLRRQADRAERNARRRQSRGARARASLEIAAHELPLWDALRELRARLAREQSVPAYVIFHDATLREIARQRPRDLEELAAIGGVGARKLERYGAPLLEVVG